MSREARITIVLLLLIAVLGVLAAINEARSAALTPLISSSAQPTGAKALALWLDELGYDVSTDALSEFVLDDIDTLLMLAPSMPVADREADHITDWIDAGGTMLLVADSFELDTLVARLTEFELSADFGPVETVGPVGPLLRDVISWDSAEISPRFVITDSGRYEPYVELINYNGQPAALTYEQGDGRIILTTLDDAFSNRGLTRPGNAELVLNLITLGGSAETGTIWFNDWHHGVRSLDITNQIIGPSAWLRRTFPGRAILFASSLLIVTLIWRGRRLGRPFSLPAANNARSPIEYITAIANLNRRASTRPALQADYHQRLKRKLGVRYRIDPSRPDNEFLQQLQLANPTLDHAAIRRLLDGLSRTTLEEAALLELVRETTDILDN